MRHFHPPISLLRAFVAVARHGGITHAADELHLTQGAVSKQVLELERQLGVALFLRVRKRLTLSAAGQRYLHTVQPVLAQLEEATLELMAHGERGGALHIAVLPTFGAKWMIPRLTDFQSRHQIGRASCRERV